MFPLAYVDLHQAQQHLHAACCARVYTHIIIHPNQDAVRVFNDATRNTVTQWLIGREWEKPPSLYHYGLMRPWKVSQVEKPITDNLPIAHDLVSYFGALLQQTAPVRYLEIGVSVGKSLFTQVRFMACRSVCT
jgi:hypothetical protein